MEYRWPRYEENPDRSLVERHDREIAPLLKRRWLFAESGNFLLYDFFTGSGAVDENVFAYSNRSGNERALVIYNNRYGGSHGTIDFSAAFADKGSGQLRQRRLAEGLGLSGDRGLVVAWRDSLTGLEYLRRAEHLLDGGLTLELHAYQSHVFLEFRELRPTAQHPWDKLCDFLNGRGVPNLEDELVNLELRPAHEALRRLLDPASVRHFADFAELPRGAAIDSNKISEAQRTEFLQQAWLAGEPFLAVARSAYAARLRAENQPALAASVADSAGEWQSFSKCLRAAMRIPALESLFASPWTAAARRMLPCSSPQFTGTSMWGPVLAWCSLQLLASAIDSADRARVALDLFDRLRLRTPLAHAFAALGFEGEESWRVAARIKVLLLVQADAGKPQESAEAAAGMSAQAVSAVSEKSGEAEADGTKPAPTNLKPSNLKSSRLEPSERETASAKPPKPKPSHPESFHLELPADLWSDPDVRWLTGAHQAEGHTYFIRERYEELLWWLLMPSLVRLAGQSSPSRAEAAELSGAVAAALGAAKVAGYRVEVLTGNAPNVDQPESSVAAGHLADAQESGAADALEIDKKDSVDRDALPKKI
jgi:hypothetical protein